MDQQKLEISSKGERQRRAEATEWWLKLRAAEPRAEDISAWLDWQGRDPRNAEAFEGVRNFAGRMRATDQSVLASLVAEFSQPMPRSASGWWGWPTRLGVTVAFIAAAVASFRLLLLPEDKPTRMEYLTPVAINRDIALPDGSNVVLGAESELKASFTASARRVDLRDGEAYFKVKHDEKRPFYVRAGKLTVRDVGTAFDVSKTGQRVTVTVTQGRVRVIEAGSETQGSTAANTVDVGAGQQVLYSPGAAGLRVARIVDPASALGWREQRLEFVDEPLASVIANINRYAEHPLRISDPSVGRFSFTGTVDLHSLDRWLAALQTIFPVRVEYGAASDAIVPVTASNHH